MILAYAIGSISNAILISKFLKKEDIRTKGSGNAGATNSLRSYGIKIGLIVFALDILKPIVAILIAWGINKHTTEQAYLPIIGFAAIVGHIYPIFFNFKGGKGAASALGFIIATQWILAIIGFIVFMLIVFKTKKVSLGSILTPVILLIIFIGLGASGSLQNYTWMPLMQNLEWWGIAIVFGLIWLLVVYKHKANIKRLLNGTERSLGEKRK